MPLHHPGVDEIDAPAALAMLADLYGVSTVGPGGAPVPTETVRHVLDAVGAPASTDHEVREALAARRRHWRPLGPSVTARTGRGARVEGLVPHGRRAEATVRTDAGRDRQCRVERHEDQAFDVGGDRLVPVTIVVPGDLLPGLHLLTLTFEVSGVSSPLLVAPQVLPPLQGGAHAWGVVGDVSVVVSQQTADAKAGRGDLGDLAELVSWVGADLGGDFVLAATPVTSWAPWTSPARIRSRDLPEAVRAQPGELDGDPEQALRAVYAVSRSPRHRRAFEAFCERGGQRLVDVATWLVLAAQHGGDPGTWPVPLRDSGSEDVAQAREHAAEDVEFHRWCQWAADRQLAEASREATAVGMRVGLVAPLAAPGVATGTLAWLHEVSAVPSVRLGAPPTDLLPYGSVGEHRPWRPGTVAELGAAPLFDQLEISRHCGGLLLDHTVNWFRQWWVPDGADPAAGTWVRQDHETLLAAVGIAAHRQGAVVLADLGELAAHESRWLLAQGVVPLSEDVGRGAVRGVSLADLAGEGPWTIEGLAANPRARRVARRLRS